MSIIPCVPFGSAFRAVLWTCAFLPVVASAGESGVSLERRMLRDAGDGELDAFSLLDAAVVANGIDSFDDCRRWTRIVDDAASAMAPRVEPIEGRRDRAAVLLAAMHKQLLRGEYRAECTDLQKTLSTGNYNCVSATIVFHALCRRFGIEPVAVATPTHVYTRIVTELGPIDVQTTCPRWFELSADQREAVTPPTAGTPREISDVELIAKVYYNQGVRCLESNRFEQAERAFDRSLLLDPRDALANENLLATLNNWALACCDGEEFEQAVRLLDRGRRIDRTYAAFGANELHVYQRWAQCHCRSGDFESAIDVLRDGASRRPDAPLFRDGPVAVYRMWAKSLARGGRTSEAARVLARALEAYPDQPELVADHGRIESVSAAGQAGTRAGDTRLRAEGPTGE